MIRVPAPTQHALDESRKFIEYARVFKERGDEQLAEHALSVAIQDLNWASWRTR